MNQKTRQVTTDSQGTPGMSQELLALLRHRVATRYYDDPRTMDAIVRRILHGGWLSQAPE